eukprot:TRINITY_DN15548_c0_g1_i1.p1 TRINITY_DN15548_c0_g1~~TRINITY_DN15548_c0_g1_i1.p1  ORF type:complete len:487 (-),score=84.88 TRINITY_DN15548_c0_g1_i1:96-1556(-)
MAGELEILSGTVASDNGKFGFIKVDDDAMPDMFVLPLACKALGGAIPPVGTRVSFNVVSDEKTGKPRAENVQLSDGGGDALGQHFFQELIEADQELSGTVVRDGGNFGFIQQDSGEADIFVMPQACGSLGGRIPQQGTRVVYQVVEDAKTGRPRAENVRLEQTASRWRPAASSASFSGGRPAPVAQPLQTYRPAAPVAQPLQTYGALQQKSGTILQENGKFGFIQQDTGEADMFVMPAACAAFGGAVPPRGTRVLYSVVLDEKTGKPRAEDVSPEVAAPAARGMAMSAPHFGHERSGTVSKGGGNFGFIQQDSGEADMFVMPVACAAFGNVIPEPGTRVVFEVVTDEKTGKIRAENVRPERAYSSPQSSYMASRAAPSTSRNRFEPYSTARAPASGSYSSYGAGPSRARQTAVVAAPGRVLTGTFAKDNGKFGFIQQDVGGEDMFVMPAACKALGLTLPAVGVRLRYEVVVDEKTGRPRAENVALE